MGVPFKKEGKGTYIVKECVVVGGERIKTLMSGGGLILPPHHLLSTTMYRPSCLKSARRRPSVPHPRLTRRHLPLSAFY